MLTATFFPGIIMLLTVIVTAAISLYVGYHIGQLRAVGFQAYRLRYSHENRILRNRLLAYEQSAFGVTAPK